MDNVGYLVLQQGVAAERPTETPASMAFSPVVGSTLQTMDRLQECISECVSSHEWCNPAQNIALPPNFRLIDVEKGCITIPSSDEIPRYVALSYVWGDVQESKTSKCITTTISQFSEKIDLENLPATIQDAIIVCKQLGERYLWVDRFCILQDDENDKSYQIHAMSAIYSAARLVIIAASGTGMMDGLSGMSRPRTTQFSRYVSGTRVIIQLPPLWDVVGSSVWDSRGWTYQEAILPTRKLFFTEAQVFFECALRIYHEEHLAYTSFDPSMHDKANYPTSTSSLGYGMLTQPKRKFDEGGLRWSRTESTWDAYKRHVYRYRHRALRHDSDILSAFMGISTALYPIENLYYGLPLSEIDLGLLWHTLSTPSLKNRMSNSSLLSSWTWAAYATEVPLFRDWDFCGTLCLWFQPAQNRTSDSDIQPIIATKTACEGSPFHRSIFHLPVAIAIMHSLIETSSPADPTWPNMPFSELETALKTKWPTYASFWISTFGRDEIFHAVQKKLTATFPTPLPPGTLLTRTQLAPLQIHPSPTSSPPFPHLHNPLTTTAIGLVVSTTHRVSSLLDQGQRTFPCAALSVSTLSASSPLYPSAKARLADVGFWDGEGIALDRVLIVNVLILVLEGDGERGKWRRVGLGEVFLRDWVRLEAGFETLVLG